jgi:DNA-binding FadR family transcriptional regulator
MKSDARVRLQRIQRTRAPQVFAAQLRQMILEGQLTDGDPLPAERQLAEQTGVGRSSVREALRTLESEGLISTRPGRGGGAVVRRPDRSTMARSIDVFVLGRQVQYATVLEARQLLETGSAHLAALRRSESDIDQLGRHHQDMVTADARDDVEAFVDANVAWHIVVNQASGNELVAGFMFGLTGVLRAAIEAEEFNTAELRSETLRSHGRILDAIVSGDGPAAARRMARHLHAHEEIFAPRFGDRVITLGTGGPEAASTTRPRIEPR